MKNLLGVIPVVTLRSFGFDRVVRRQLDRKVDNDVGRVHQGLVEPLLLGARGFTLMGVVGVGDQKFLVALDLPDSLSPQLLPIFRNVQTYQQDAFHENIDVDKDPVAFEVLSNVLVFDAIVFWSFVRLLQDGRPTESGVESRAERVASYLRSGAFGAHCVEVEVDKIV
jgi:hypothetical protein